MDALLILLLGVVSVVVVIGAVTSGKKEDPLRTHRPRREAISTERPVFLSYDQQWKSVASEAPLNHGEEIPETVAEETTAAR